MSTAVRRESPVATLAGMEYLARRQLARFQAWRRFRNTRKVLLELDAHTLQDITGLSHAQIRKMNGSAADRCRLGMQ